VFLKKYNYRNFGVSFSHGELKCSANNLNKSTLVVLMSVKSDSYGEFYSSYGEMHCDEILLFGELKMY